MLDFFGFSGGASTSESEIRTTISVSCDSTSGSGCGDGGFSGVFLGDEFSDVLDFCGDFGANSFGGGILTGSVVSG